MDKALAKIKEETKVCTKCKQEKVLSRFSVNRRSKDGLQHRCKKCDAMATKRYKERKAMQIAIRRGGLSVFSGGYEGTI